MTIEIFKLNARGRPQARKRALNMLMDFAPEERRKWIPDLPFRYLLWQAILDADPV